MSYDIGPDDETASVLTFWDGGPQEVVGDEVSAHDELKAEAEAAQRLVVTRLLRQHVKGRMEVGVPVDSKKVLERRFNVGKVYEWTKGEPEEVQEALSYGRVRARVNAAMGTGKSTSLSPRLASRQSKRVLLVGLDALQLQKNAIFIANRAIGRVSRRCTEKQEARVNVMTYADFNSHHVSSRPSAFYKNYDIIVFDEAFVAEADVFVAKRAFAVYASADVSLLLCSATMRTDLDLEKTGSAKMGNFRHFQTSVSLKEAIDSKKLVGEYLVDQTIVILPTDTMMQQLTAYYESEGVDARMLDSAATFEDEREVDEWLVGDSTTPRVLVACTKYAIGYNGTFSYMVLWPYRSFNCLEGNECRERIVPMTEEMVVQAMARTGRGLAGSSGGMVMSPERETTVELYESDKMAAFVKLCAMSIEPLHNEFWASCYALFPNGLKASEAYSLGKPCLPFEVTARYLAADGLVAAKFQRALNFYSQPDHFVQPSAEEYPVGYESWIHEPMGGYVGQVEDCGFESLSVPIVATGELRVMLHAISAMAEGKINLLRWQPARPMAFDDGYDSAEEEHDSRFGARGGGLRRVKLRELPVVRQEQFETPKEWAFHSGSQTTSRRSGYVSYPERIQESLRMLDPMVPKYSVPVVNGFEFDSEGQNDSGVVRFGSVESPGGSEVCRLPLNVCQKLNVGKNLNGEEFVSLAMVARKDWARFVASKVFDCFAGPWDGILNSLLDPAVVNQLVLAGLASDVYEMVNLLRKRHSIEVNSILAKSNVYTRTYLNVFRNIRPSVDDLMRALRKGAFDRVAQTDGFLNRVRDLKTTIDNVLLFAEGHGVWLPTYITEAQRGLPVRGQAPLGVLGTGMTVMPKSVAGHLRQRSEGTLENRLRGRFERKAAKQSGSVDLGEIDSANF